MVDAVMVIIFIGIPLVMVAAIVLRWALRINTIVAGLEDIVELLKKIDAALRQRP